MVFFARGRKVCWISFDLSCGLVSFAKRRKVVWISFDLLWILRLPVFQLLCFAVSLGELLFVGGGGSGNFVRHDCSQSPSPVDDRVASGGGLRPLGRLDS
jgi:hypothetical protein